MFRDVATSPLVLTLHPQITDSTAYFDYSIVPPFQSIHEALLEISNDDANDAQLVLRWAFPDENPNYEFAERTTDEDGHGAILAITPQIEQNQTRFLITPPAYPRYGRVELVSPSPTYKLAVTVKRKS